MIQMKHSEDRSFTTYDSPRFDVLRFPDRWPELLELRRAAYVADGLVSPETNAADLYDPRDDRAAVVVAQSQGRLVGSLRLTPSLEAGPILHHTCQFAEPVRGLPDKSEYLEVSRVCVIPEHRGHGLLWELAARMVILAREQGKRFLVGGIRPGLWPYWQRCGYRKTGVTYRQMGFGGIEHEVGILDVEETLTGRSLDPKFARVLLPLVEERRRQTGRLRVFEAG